MVRMNDKYGYLDISSCTVLPKKSNVWADKNPQRFPFLILGKFETRAEFNKAVREALRDEDGYQYDLRTVKFHDSISIRTDKKNSAVSLQDLFEDTIWEGRDK